MKLFARTSFVTNVSVHIAAVDQSDREVNGTDDNKGHYQAHYLKNIARVDKIAPNLR